MQRAELRVVSEDSDEPPHRKPHWTWKIIRIEIACAIVEIIVILIARLLGWL